MTTLHDIRTAASQLIDQIDRLNANPDPESDKQACEQITDYWNAAGELATLLIADRIDGNIRAELRQCDAMGTYATSSGLLDKARDFMGHEIRHALDMVLKDCGHDAKVTKDIAIMRDYSCEDNIPF